MDQLSAAPVSFSAVNDQTYLLMPGDLNANNTAFGGKIMEIADRLAGTVAIRHSGSICVTLLVDSMKFLHPARQGDVLVFKAAVNRTWKTSMEVGVKVYAENFQTGTRKHVVSAYFTFVAVDENQRPKEIRGVVSETDDETRRYIDADRRRARRLTDARASQT